MRRLSAFDAIGPAWDHAWALMFAPRRWRLMVKIGAVAFFAQMGGCNSSFNRINGPPTPIPGWTHGLTLALIAFGVVVFLIGLALFYVGSRLQFVLFEMVLRRDTFVGPIWRRYGAATWRWIWLKVLFFIVAVVCMAPILVPMALYFVHHVPSPEHPSAASFGPMFASILGFIGAVFLLIILVTCAYSLLADFGLPSMALEGTPLGETVRRVMTLIRMEPGQVLLYLFMRVVLGLVGAIGGYIMLLVVGLVLAVPLGGGAFVLWLVLHGAGMGGHVAMIAGFVALGAIFFCLMFIAAMVVFGGLFTFVQAYALYFLGGRYWLVGQYLEPEPVFVAPPPLPG